jgi:electron transfer flavoprotein beta subunit
MGVDEGIILSDLKFAGSDVLSTAYTLSRAIKKINNFDLVICGKQTTDGDTAQVGSELAEFLSIPNISEVKDIINIDKGEIHLVSESDDYLSMVKMLLPGLICVSKENVQPRLPSYKLKKLRENDEIPIWTIKELPDVGEGYFGLDGSPTRVVRIFPPEHDTRKNLYRESEKDMSERFLKILYSEKFIEV